MTRDATPLMEVNHLKKWFPIRGGILSRTVGHVKAVNDVSFYVNRGEVLGLVGESGSGKTTVGRTILRLIEPTDGQVIFDGTDVVGLSKPDLRPFRRRMQIIFQDPFASLNPRMTVGDIIAEPLIIHRLVKTAQERTDRVPSCSNSWASRRTTCAATRTSSPAGSASASASPAPSRWIPSSSWPTSPFPHSMSPFRPRS